MTPEQIADAFLVRSLFSPGQMRVVETNLDRLVAGAAVPAPELELAAGSELTLNREFGIVNLGAAGTIGAGGERFSLRTCDFLYVGAGGSDIVFESGQTGQAAYYFLSCPAHRRLPTTLMHLEDAERQHLGDSGTASARSLHKFIYPGGIESCQLSMGFTELKPGSVWNTMPAHTHNRRSEIYLYFELKEAFVAHFLGEPDNTRHVFVRDREAVLSPSWSVHFGAGTGPYRFVWGMAGENKDFSDVDPVSSRDLR